MITKKHKLALSVLYFTLLSISAEAGLKIYYIRHAEAGHNVKKDWEKKGVPESEWPEYVGDSRMFTPKGKEQLTKATKKLKEIDFDFIAASPMWRTRNTILPYLKETESKAEIWPELHEASGSGEILDDDLPELKIPILGAGDLIEIPDEEAPYFVLQEDNKHEFHRPKRDEGKIYSTAALKIALTAAIEKINTQFGDSEKTILLVGHGGSGRALLRLITQSDYVGEERGSPDNAALWMVEQQDDKSYQLKMYNDAVVTPEED